MQTMLKTSGVFLLKAITFSIIFWVIWVYIVRPITNAQSSTVSQSSKTEMKSNENEEAMKIYKEQAKKAEEQQRRVDKIISKQEEQGRRLDAVLSGWEKTIKAPK
ncbi:MAG TPA: hypothetical protein VK572_11265 [Burkholderiales bacterium]|nr:hypothetical protein [Burkholderiales bacterium]